MTISSGEIKRNMTIILQDEIYQILEWQHRQAPKAPPTLTLKLRHIETGNVYEKKVSGNQKLELALTDTIDAQFLYKDKSFFIFMYHKLHLRKSKKILRTIHLIISIFLHFLDINVDNHSKAPKITKLPKVTLSEDEKCDLDKDYFFKNI